MIQCASTPTSQLKRVQNLSCDEFDHAINPKAVYLITQLILKHYTALGLIAWSNSSHDKFCTLFNCDIGGNASTYKCLTFKLSMCH